jgi:hypothetical protein
LALSVVVCILLNPVVASAVAAVGVVRVIDVRSASAGAVEIQ